VFALSFVLLVFSAKAGDALRRKVSRVRENVGHNLGVVLTGALTLMALIIGFSFSMAINHYDLRKTYEQAEAVAIAIEYVRADLLPRGDASRAQEFLRNYLVLFYTTRDQRQLAEIAGSTAQIQSELWLPSGLQSLRYLHRWKGVVVTGMTDVVNSQLSTQAAWLNRIPVATWVLNLASASAASS
jgi:hypothetical protein